MHGSDHEFCRQISEQTKYTVLDVPYRLAPEDPFPTAINNVKDAIKYALGRPDEFDLPCLSLSGFSAGANRALAASAILFSPETFRSLIAFDSPLDLNADAATKVAPDPKGRVIPVRIARRSVPAPHLMIICEGDSRALEGEKLAEKLQHEGHYVVREHMYGCNHGWDKRTRVGTPQRQAKEQAYKLAVEMLNE